VSLISSRTTYGGPEVRNREKPAPYCSLDWSPAGNIVFCSLKRRPSTLPTTNIRIQRWTSLTIWHYCFTVTSTNRRERDTVACGTALNWNWLVFSLWKEFTSNWNLKKDTHRLHPEIRFNLCNGFLDIQSFTNKSVFSVLFCSYCDITLSYLLKNTADRVSGICKLAMKW